MTKKVYKKIARTPSHAGRILKSGFMEEHDLRVETIAGLLGITRQHFSRILNGHNPITSDIAIKLEMITGTPATQWLAIQAKYDAHILEQGSDYKKYRKAIHLWAANSLDMQPKDRRGDTKTKELVQEAAGLAKNLSRKKVATG